MSITLKVFSVVIILVIAGFSMWENPPTVIKQNTTINEEGYQTKNIHLYEHKTALVTDNTHEIDDSHHHEKALEQNTDIEGHHLIPEDIKSSICVVDSRISDCIVNLEVDYSSQLTSDKGNILSDEVGVILSSVNFVDVLNDMSAKKKSNEAFEREYQYTDELNFLSAEYDVKNQGVFCDDTSCGMIVTSDTVEDYNKFDKAFFSDVEKGNLFIAQIPDENGQFIINRIMFFPNNLKPMITRIKD